MAEIQLRESFGTFAYFLVTTLALGLAGFYFPGMGQPIGDVLQEHIAGKSIQVLTAVAWFLAFACAIRNLLKPAAYGKVIRLLIVNPTNFTITLALVAAAVNWSVAFSALIALPGVVGTKAFSERLPSALQISGIAIGIAIGAWFLHHSPDARKTCQPFSSWHVVAFWVVFAASAIFWLAFICTLVAKALGLA